MKKPLLGKTARMTARLLFLGEMTLTFDQLPFTLRNVPLGKRLNFLRQGLQILKRPVRRLGIPPILQIEPTNTCNLRCLTCATGAGLMKRPPVQMPLALYQRVIDQVKDYAYLLVFWSWGEPFLNSDACRMIRYAKDNGLLVHTSTNGHFFKTREQAEKVVGSGLDSLIVAVDGLDQQTYEKYRSGGNLQMVIDSIKNLVTARLSLGVDHPRITLRFLVMKHNEHQVGRVREFARDLGVDAVTFRSAVMRRSEIDLEDRLVPQASEFQRFSHKSHGSEPQRTDQLQNHCHRPYANLTIFSNGDVVACENDYNATFSLGNAAKENLRDILSSGRARDFLKAFRQDMDRFAFCRECENRYIKGRTANVQTHALNRKFTHHETSA